MAYFSLDDGLMVGNTFIDSDHQRFADILNEFQHAMVRGEGEDLLGEVLNALILYTREHFKREEAYMHSIHYADFDTHKEEHDKLVKDLLLLQSRFIMDNSVMTVQVASFLRNWLVNHILETDKKLTSAHKQGPVL